LKDLAALVALYAELDRHLEADRSAAARLNDRVGVERAARKQRLNEQAYFLICWGQLETEIDNACRASIRTRQDSSNWAERRAWDLYNPDDKRLSGLAFEDRAALVLDKQAGRGSPWALVMSYYALRNRIAHGTLHPDGIDIAEVANDFYKVLAALAR
jgi:hypothetical protein